MKLFSSILALIAVFLQQSYGQMCEPRDNKCECVFPNGTGYSLHNIVKNNDKLEAITNQNLTFYYHPCGDDKLHLPEEVANECSDGYSFCMLNRTNNTATVLGKLGDLSFNSDGGSMRLIFVRPNAPTEDLQKSSITLMCVPEAKSSILFAPLERIRQVNLFLYSPEGCSKLLVPGHGFFYIFFVVILTLLFSYLFIGILVNYFLVGARGFELIPNYDFWCRSWRSLKLFYIYVKNGCRVIPAEDTYDAI